MKRPDGPEPCIADGCAKVAERGRKYCHGHRKREKQHRPVDTPLREWGTDPAQYLEAKALGLADAKDTDARAYQLARRLLRTAALAYAAKVLRQKVPRASQSDG